MSSYCTYNTCKHWSWIAHYPAAICLQLACLTCFNKRAPSSLHYKERGRVGRRRHIWGERRSEEDCYKVRGGGNQEAHGREKEWRRLLKGEGQGRWGGIWGNGVKRIVIRWGAGETIHVEETEWKRLLTESTAWLHSLTRLSSAPWIRTSQAIWSMTLNSLFWGERKRERRGKVMAAMLIVSLTSLFFWRSTKQPCTFWLKAPSELRKLWSIVISVTLKIIRTTMITMTIKQWQQWQLNNDNNDN